MFENISYFFKRMVKPEQKELGSKDAAKERLHLVLMQDRANVSADFLELMKQEIIDVIKKYIVVDEKSIDVRLTNKSNDDGTTGAPALYANIPIVNIKNDMMAEKEKKFEGIDFNKVIDGKTLLISAVLSDNRTCAKVLLDLKANPDICDENGVSPLMHAVIDDNRSMVRLLMDYGADPYLKDHTGRHAASCSRSELMDELLRTRDK